MTSDLGGSILRELNLIFQNSPSLFVLEKISNPLFMRASLKTNCCVLVSASRCTSLSHASTFRPVDPARPNKLFLAITSPHNPVKSATLAHWIENLLVKSGIDSNIFTAHSTRGAASSTTARAGMSVSDILRIADWTSDNTFQRFYYKPFQDPSFGRTVLSVT